MDERERTRRRCPTGRLCSRSNPASLTRPPSGLRFVSQAWSPYLQWAGQAAPQIARSLTALNPASTPSLTADQLASALALGATQSAVLESWQKGASREVLAPLLRTGVSTQDLLIVLNFLFEAAIEGAEQAETAELEGVPSASIERLQEGLDQLVEAGGPEGESKVVDAGALTNALQQANIPLVAWPALVERLTQGVREQELEGEQGAAGQAAGSAAAAPAAASSSSSAGASSAGPKKATGKSGSSTSGSAAGFGGAGGLDLSISGFSIKPPSKQGLAGAGKK